VQVYRWGRSNNDYWRRQKHQKLKNKLAEVESYYEELARRFHTFSELATLRCLVRGRCADETYV
jgi:hypothetical protein